MPLFSLGAPAGQIRCPWRRFLVIPLRLTGVMVNEHGMWRIRQVQFQFDLNLSALLLVDVLLLSWMAINVAWLAAAVFRRLARRTDE